MNIRKAILGIKFVCPHCTKQSHAEPKLFQYDGFYCANCSEKSAIKFNLLWSSLHAVIGATLLLFLNINKFMIHWPVFLQLLVLGVPLFFIGLITARKIFARYYTWRKGAPGRGK